MILRILVVNDDGPPSDVSPYFAPFVASLEARGHRVRVVIPDRPLSWIGKAHAVGKQLTCNSVCPYSYSSTSLCPAPNDAACDEHRWWILDGFPASCTQIGLFHLDWGFEDFDLVISGPNHGRNASTVYNLSSGTVGGALEAALCGKQAISLSFGSKEPQPASLVDSACVRAVRIIESLYENWSAEVEFYHINVPLVSHVDSCPAVYTMPSRCYWTHGSLFAAASDDEDNVTDGPKRGRRRRFIWKPDLTDVKRAEQHSRPGEDLWASSNALISVTGLRANFAAAGPPEGKL